MAAETDAGWVPIAVSADILDGTVVPARLPSGPIAVWRSASGQLFANGDRCPHRGMRLSHGFVRGDTLSCIYHGWRFGTDGACQKIPAHPNVVPPKTINCGPLPVAESNGVVWGAVNQPAQAPVAFDGYVALRSLVMQATAAQITKDSAGASIEGAIKISLDGHDALLLMSTYGPQDTFVVVLVPTDLSLQDRLAVSTACEALRRRVETMEDPA